MPPYDPIPHPCKLSVFSEGAAPSAVLIAATPTGPSMLKLRSSEVRGKCSPLVEVAVPVLLLLRLLRSPPARPFVAALPLAPPRRRGDAPRRGDDARPLPPLAPVVPPLPPAMTCPRSSSARGESVECVSERERSVLLDPRAAGRRASSSFSQLWILATPTRVAKAEPDAGAEDEDEDEPRPPLPLFLLPPRPLPLPWAAVAFFPFFVFPILGLKSQSETQSEVSVELARSALASCDPTFGATDIGTFPLRSTCSSSRLSRSAAKISPAAFPPSRLLERSRLCITADDADDLGR